MTPQELRAVVSGIVDSAGRHRLSGEVAYANGLMDAADRLKPYLSKETPAKAEPVPRVDADLTVVDVPKAAEKYVAADAVDDPPKRRRIKRAKS